MNVRSIMSGSRTLGLAVALGVMLVFSAGPAVAFLQKTTVRGTIGADIGGIWLALHDLAPSFRVRVDRIEGDSVMPFRVAEVGPEAARVVGARGGVVISELIDPKAGGKYGIFEGDIITKVNTAQVRSLADYDKAISGIKKYGLIMIRRPSLASTRARLLKIRYRPVEGEVDGTSAIVGEDINVHVKDVVFPFNEQLERSVRKRELWSPSEADLKKLAATWHELVAPKRATFVGGDFEVIDAGAYDPTQRKDVELEDTIFAIIANMAGNPLTGGGSVIGIYGIRETGLGKLSGSYVEATLASAPFPISVDFNGTFRMIRLADYSTKDVDAARAKRAAEVKGEQAKVRLAPDLPPPGK